MTTKHNVLVIALSLTIAAMIPFFYINHKGKNIEYRIFHITTGWGYDVFIDKKLFIHQQFIPGLSDKNGFAKETFAKEAAEAVISKLKNNKSPTFTNEEVEQICRGNKN